MTAIRIFTIGFTNTTAERFFTKLGDAGVERVVDVRLNNTSQLAGFSKRDDLAYFLRRLVSIEYVHMPELAPTQDILTAFKKEKGPWEDYEQKFLSLMKNRRIAETIPTGSLSGSCLLCSEHEPTHCHGRLVAEYLRQHWEAVEIIHL